MKKSLRIEGIYDKSTLELLQNVSVNNFAFDFRPTSFNFLQQHRFLELIKSLSLKNKRIFLQYENEPDFVIEKMITDLKNELAQTKDQWINGNIYLEFLGQEEPSFKDSFSTPFITLFNPHENLESVLNCENIKGIVFDFVTLEQMHRSDKLMSFISSFFQKHYQNIQSRDIKLILKRDWDSDIFPSLFDLIEFDYVSLPINQKVEMSYRNLDFNKFQNEINHVKKLNIANK